MAISHYTSNNFDVTVTVEVKDKDGNILKIKKHKLDTDNDDFQVIHDFDYKLHGFIQCHFSKLTRLGRY